MDLGITGKTALVLGGGEGLGQAISTVLASEGANIAIADIDQNSIAGTEAAAKACNGSLSGHWRFHHGLIDLIAMAGRAGIKIDLDTFHRL
jgi:NAD(P)-dependent dehydrogenase (short-subunit alcohol dehydrogenase family)